MDHSQAECSSGMSTATRASMIRTNF
jgi:hypothetical protein